MLKQLGKLAAFGVFVYVAAVILERYGYPPYSVGIVILLGGMLLGQFRAEQRLASLEERVTKPDFDGVRKLLEGPRHKPEHKQPASLVAGGAGASRINKAHEILFEDFRWFGAVLNRHLADAWAIEELPDTKVASFEGFDIGRRYDVWYNAAKVGSIEVTLGGASVLAPDKFEENRKASVDVKLNHLRFIPYSDAKWLLHEIAMLTGKLDENDGEALRAKAEAKAANALGGYLWEAVREPEWDSPFEFNAEGPYDILRKISAHWKENGIDPMKEWGGDRLEPTA